MYFAQLAVGIKADVFGRLDGVEWAGICVFCTSFLWGGNTWRRVLLCFGAEFGDIVVPHRDCNLSGFFNVEREFVFFHDWV